MAIGAGFGKGMMQGSTFARSVYDAYKDSAAREEQAEQKKAFSEIAKATPESSQGFTADQGGELEKLAGQGYEVGYDQGQNAYVAKNAAGDTKTVAMQGVTDFMGQRKVGTMSQADTDNARMLAMADVVGKNDPFKGLQLRKEVRDSEYQATKQAREKKTWDKEDSIDAIDTKLGQEWESGLVGEDGAKRAPSASDYMQASQQRAFAYAKAGHMKEAQSAFKENLATAHIKIQMDSAERKQAMGPAMAAIASGDYGAVADFYNKYVPSGSKVTSIEGGKDGAIVMNRVGMDGQPMAPMQFKDKREAMAALSSVEKPSALYEYSQDEFLNQIALRRDARADNADRRADNSDRRADRADGRAAAAAGRAAANQNTERGEKSQRASVREALYKELNPNATPTQVQAARLGLIDIPGTGKAKDEAYSYNPVEIQKSFGETSSDPITGKDTVKRNYAKEQRFQDFWADNPQIKNQDRALQEFNRSESKAARKGRAEDGESQGAIKAAISPASIAATAKKHNMTVDEVKAELQARGLMK